MEPNTLPGDTPKVETPKKGSTKKVAIFIFGCIIIPILLAISAVVGVIVYANSQESKYKAEVGKVYDSSKSIPTDLEKSILNDYEADFSGQVQEDLNKSIEHALTTIEESKKAVKEFKDIKQSSGFNTEIKTKVNEYYTNIEQATSEYEVLVIFNDKTKNFYGDVLSVQELVKTMNTVDTTQEIRDFKAKFVEYQKLIEDDLKFLRTIEVPSDIQFEKDYTEKIIVTYVDFLNEFLKFLDKSIEAYEKLDRSIMDQASADLDLAYENFNKGLDDTDYTNAQFAYLNKIKYKLNKAQTLQKEIDVLLEEK